MCIVGGRYRSWIRLSREEQDRLFTQAMMRYRRLRKKSICVHSDAPYPGMQITKALVH